MGEGISQFRLILPTLKWLTPFEIVPRIRNLFRPILVDNDCENRHLIRGLVGLGAIAQLGERYNGIVEVGGSIPPSSTN